MIRRPIRRRNGLVRALAALALGLNGLIRIHSAENVLLTEMPDYSWHAGCFGTATGNLMGYWDRHGLPDLYTGPTANGVAPLNSIGPNESIRSMWASQAGLDGRPAGQFGHVDDYWGFYGDDDSNSYESTDPDPYLAAGRPEHPPDCLGDFIGASQNKWTNLNGECDGNIDAFAVTYWDLTGDKRANFIPPPQGAIPVRDIPSGLLAWTQYRGYDCVVFSQLSSFNPNIATGSGFTFEDLKREIDAGYPVMLFLQGFVDSSRSLPGMRRANPDVHGMVAYGYLVTEDGFKYARYKTSWGSSGDNRLRSWNSAFWEAFLPVRGVIGYHPLPRVTQVTRTSDSITLKWHGPSSTLYNLLSQTSVQVHRYVVERSASFDHADFQPVSEPTTALEATLPKCCDDTAFFRVRLLPR